MSSVYGRGGLILCAAGLVAACNETPPAQPLSPGLGPKAHSVLISRLGPGLVRSEPAGIVCGFECEGTFAEGTEVQLNAEPVLGSRFIGWSGQCAGTTPICRFTVREARVISAQFFTTAGDAGVALDAAPGQDAAVTDSGTVSQDAGLLDGAGLDAGEDGDAEPGDGADASD